MLKVLIDNICGFMKNETTQYLIDLQGHADLLLILMMCILFQKMKTNPVKLLRKTICTDMQNH